MRVTGATVLLTGATGGIGRAIAVTLSRLGARLVLSGRRTEELGELAVTLGARSIVADLADPAQVQRLAEEAGDVDVLIANAALPASGALLDYTPDQLARALAVNLHAPILLCRLLAPRMVTDGRGHLVLIGSISGKVASPTTSLYNASKFGLRGFAHAFRQDLHGTGVGVSIVQPGFVSDAGMFATTGVTLPPGVGTVTPDRVARATVKAIEGNRGEVDVAPVGMRLASLVGGLFPELAGKVQRRTGGQTVTQLVEAQQSRR